MKNLKYFTIAFGLISLGSTVVQAASIDSEAEGCIISRETGAKYCLKPGERSGYSLPQWIYNHAVDVLAPSGISVMLSDWDNLSYNRLAMFDGYTGNDELKNVKAYNGQILDFSHPRSMRVLASDTYPEACIISRKSGERFCLKEGERSGYSLPAYIYGHEVDVEAPKGLGVMLSDWDNLSYNRLAVFGGDTASSLLNAVKAYNGEILDFSHPHSMRVVPYTKPIDVIETNLKWSWERSQFKPEFNQVMATPVVAQLNDDNHDGKIDNNDVADIIVVTFESNKYNAGGIVRALSGVDGSELWSYSNGGIIADARYTPAVADLDSDGLVEIVTTSLNSAYINVLDIEGNIKKQIEKTKTGGGASGNITLTDLDGDSSVEILSADGVYNYDTGLVFSHSWTPSSISGDFDGDKVQEIFMNGDLYKADGSLSWQYDKKDFAWFSSLVNLDDDEFPEVVVSVPASVATAQNSRFAVLEHDGSVKWEINSMSNPGGGVQAISNFLGKKITETSKWSHVFGYTGHSTAYTISVNNSDPLFVRSGAAIDAIGISRNAITGGNGGSFNSPLQLNQVASIDITSGKYWWGGEHVLALEFHLKNGSTVFMGSKHYAFSKKTERLQIPENSRIRNIKAWTAGWLIDGLQFEIVSEQANNDVKGIVHAGYTAVDMYNKNGELIWSVPNDDRTSGKIGVSAYDFDGDGVDEVIVQDQMRVRILDGQTGNERAIIANSSATLWEYPIVVDLAGDNNAELIVVANDFDKNYVVNHGVFVYESADASKPWASATRIWNQHAFHLTNVTQDGVVPTNATPSWLSHNTYRSSTLRATGGGEVSNFGLLKYSAIATCRDGG